MTENTAQDEDWPTRTYVRAVNVFGLTLCNSLQLCSTEEYILTTICGGYLLLAVACDSSLRSPRSHLLGVQTTAALLYSIMAVCPDLWTGRGHGIRDCDCDYRPVLDPCPGSDPGSDPGVYSHWTPGDDHLPFGCDRGHAAGTSEVRTDGSSASEPTHLLVAVWRERPSTVWLPGGYNTRDC